MTKEETIKNYMDTLNISRLEAESLWLDDQEDYIGEEGEKMEKNAKEMKARYEHGKDKKDRKPRERKVDNIKLDMLQTMAAAIEAEYDVEVNIEKEVNLHFTIDGEDYSVKLTRHRKKKGNK